MGRLRLEACRDVVERAAECGMATGTGRKGDESFSAMYGLGKTTEWT
jgi:hypothetical protein